MATEEREVCGALKLRSRLAPQPNDFAVHDFAFLQTRADGKIMERKIIGIWAPCLQLRFAFRPLHNDELV